MTIKESIDWILEQAHPYKSGLLRVSKSQFSKLDKPFSKLARLGSFDQKQESTQITVGNIRVVPDARLRGAHARFEVAA